MAQRLQIRFHSRISQPVSVKRPQRPGTASRALADELAQHGIRINSVSPGQIATPMLLQGLEAVPGQLEAFQNHILLGRLGEPEEVGRAVRFLMSDEASYITTAELLVDGGNVSSQRL